jgi:hypothetical protein
VIGEIVRRVWAAAVVEWRSVLSLRQNPIAYLALFIALGGSAYASVSVPSNSVGTRQLRNSAVTASKLHERAVTAGAIAPNSVGAGALRAGAVTGTKIAPGSLTAAAFAPGTLPSPAVSRMLVTAVSGVFVGPSSVAPPGPSPAGTTGSEPTNCPFGEQATGGGYQVPPAEQAVLEITSSMPTTYPGSTIAMGWSVGYTLLQASSTAPAGLSVYVICAALK